MVSFLHAYKPSLANSGRPPATCSSPGQGVRGSKFKLFHIFDTMKSIFELEAKNEILLRIEKLHPETKNLWGKMNVAQMLCHCANGMGLATGKIKPPRQLVGKLLGWIFKPAYYNNRNFPKNIQTIKGGAVVE